MDEKLVPAHIHFTKWFIRIRWFATLVLVIAAFTVKHFFEVDIQENSIYFLAGILLLLNILHRIILQQLKKERGSGAIRKIKYEIHFQIITDLIILTIILHFSGGIENPVIIFYFFHLIIASSIFTTTQTYIYAFFTIILAASLALLECFSVVPHYPLTDFIQNDLYKDVYYVFGAGLVFTITSFLIVFLSHMIISRSIKTEETYVKTNFELENKDKLKNEYVLRVTHDIKGHVAAILSCLDVIRSGFAGQLTNDQKEFSDRAYQRTEQLSSFIKDLLNLTRKRLRHDTEFEEFVLKDLISKVTDNVLPLAKDKSINFSWSVDQVVGKITGNPFAIEELYTNLLLNAIKYTPVKGYVLMVIRDYHDSIVSEISDSGIGILKEDLPYIFDEFYRASNVPKDLKSGSGLGLSIAKQIVESHKGEISVTSEPGVWTKVIFRLPKSHSSIV